MPHKTLTFTILKSLHCRISYKYIIIRQQSRFLSILLASSHYSQHSQYLHTSDSTIIDVWVLGNIFNEPLKIWSLIGCQEIHFQYTNICVFIVGNPQSRPSQTHIFRP